MAFGMVALSAMILPLSFSTFADDDDGPKVRSSKWKCTGREDRERCKCKTENEFKTTSDVYAKGEHFPALTNVDIYVTLNEKWQQGDPISDISTDGVETVATDEDGKIPCTKIWGNTLAKERYDIVVDTNQDGTYDPADGDAIDGRSNNAGFRVK